MDTPNSVLQVDLDELYPMDTFVFRKGPLSPWKTENT